MIFRYALLALLATAAFAQGQKDLDEANTPHRSAAIWKMSSAQLVAVLEDSDSSEFSKAKACQRLAVVGDASAIPALAALLSDPTLSHYARAGLETIPGPAADAALREALATLDGDLLIGAINSVGRRRDPKALDALAKLRSHENLAIAQAANATIARIRRP